MTSSYDPLTAWILEALDKNCNTVEEIKEFLTNRKYPVKFHEVGLYNILTKLEKDFDIVEKQYHLKDGRNILVLLK